MFWETRWPILNSGGHGTKTTHFLASDLHNVTVVCTAYLANRSEKVKNTPTSERLSNLKNKVTQMKSIHMCYIYYIQHLLGCLGHFSIFSQPFLNWDFCVEANILRHIVFKVSMTIFSEVMVILVVRNGHVLGDTLAYSKQWRPWH